MPGLLRLRALVVAISAAACIVSTSPALPAGPTAAAASPAERVVAIARSKIGARYHYGAAGPSAFDCSGLVLYVFRKAGLGATIGNGRYRSASALYAWFRRRGLASRTRPRIGDIVVWGGGQHVGIYVGNGRAVSALLSGVRLHGVTAVVAPFTAYLHTGLVGAVQAAAPVSSPAATRLTAVPANLRSGPSVAYRAIRVLAARTAVRVLRAAKDSAGWTWLRVSVGGRIGWVAGWLTHPA